MAMTMLEVVLICNDFGSVESIGETMAPRSPAPEPPRCPWALGDPLLTEYHDREWGVPVREDGKLFELLILEGAQAGLSWLTILRRREGYRRAFAGFDAAAMARFDARKVEALMADPGIIRNRLKIEGALRNARAYLAVCEAEGFARYVWGFVGGRPMVRHPGPAAPARATSPESDAMSRDLKRRGFTFVGSTICYAFMQATGMVDDHVRGCFRARKKARRG